VKSQWKLPFTVLSDVGNRYASRLGLAWTLPESLQQIYAQFGIDLPTLHDDSAWQLPVPARFVIDSAGTIGRVEADTDYTTRPEIEPTLEFLRTLT